MKGQSFLSILAAALAPILMLALIVIGATSGLVAWRPPLLWTENFGTLATTNGITDVKADATNVYLTGYFNGAANATHFFNPDFGIPFLRKNNANGETLWTKTIENASQSSLLERIVLKPDGVYVAGTVGLENETISKYDLDGNKLWSQDTGALSELEISANTGGLLVAGYSRHPVTNQSSTGSVRFVREYNADGNIVWTSEIANTTYPANVGVIQGIYASNTRIFVLAEQALIVTDSNVRKLSTQYFVGSLGIFPYSITGDGTGIYVSGNERACTICIPTGFLSKYDSDGTPLHNATFSDPEGIARSFVAIDSSSIYMSAITTNGRGLILKYDTNLNQMWNFPTLERPGRILGTRGGVRMAVSAAAGTFYLAGSSQPSNPNGSTGLLQKFGGDSSLIFLGLNPPSSFIILALIIAVAVLGPLLLRKRYKRKILTSPHSSRSID